MIPQVPATQAKLKIHKRILFRVSMRSLIVSYPEKEVFIVTRPRGTTLLSCTIGLISPVEHHGNVLPVVGDLKIHRDV